MSAKTIMVQGTGSSVGKSLLATALCRIFRQDGYRAAPFKAQNMSLNSSVTPEGAEIGRAQAVQAEAAGVAPTVDMNPVLLKPEVDYRSQLIVMGKPEGHIESRRFNNRKNSLWEVVSGALDRLRSQFEVVVIEGAGSPAEINLRHGDIVNMKVALYADAPVLLVGDISLGGVFASLYGTTELLAPEEKKLVAGTIVNKFRGDASLLEPGLRELEELTGVPVLGVVPYFHDIDIPEEDSPADRSRGSNGNTVLKIAVVALPHISNFDDFDPLARERGVEVRFVREPDELIEPDLIVVPGTKTTVADLAHLRDTGIADRLTALARAGIPVIGVCIWIPDARPPGPGPGARRVGPGRGRSPGAPASGHKVWRRQTDGVGHGQRLCQPRPAGRIGRHVDQGLRDPHGGYHRRWRGTTGGALSPVGNVSRSSRWSHQRGRLDFRDVSSRPVPQ